MNYHHARGFGQQGNSRRTRSGGYRLSQMYPRDWITYKDLPHGAYVIVTIADVFPQDVTVKQEAGGPAIVDQRWCMRIYEDHRYVRLGKSDPDVLAELFGTDDTNDLIDKQVCLFLRQGSGATSHLFFVSIYRPPLNAPHIPQVAMPWDEAQEMLERQLAGTARALPIGQAGPPPTPESKRRTYDGGKLGHDEAQRIQQLLTERGVTIDDFCRWVRTRDPECFAAVSYTAIEDMPVTVRAPLRAFMNDRPWPPGSQPGDVVATQPAAQPTQPAGSGQPSSHHEGSTQQAGMPPTAASTTQAAFTTAAHGRAAGATPAGPQPAAQPPAAASHPAAPPAPPTQHAVSEDATDGELNNAIGNTDGQQGGYEPLNEEEIPF